MPVSHTTRTKPSAAFSPAERAFFAAGVRMRIDPVPEPQQQGGARRTGLRLIAITVLAAAGVLAWQGPIKAAAPRLAALMQPAAAARSGATARTLDAMQGAHVVSKAPAAVPGPRPAPHPATANRQRARHR